MILKDPFTKKSNFSSSDKYKVLNYIREQALMPTSNWRGIKIYARVQITKDGDIKAFSDIQKTNKKKVVTPSTRRNGKDKVEFFPKNWNVNYYEIPYIVLRNLNVVEISCNYSGYKTIFKTKDGKILNHRLVEITK